MSAVKPKGMKERFAEFFEDPAKDSLRKLLEESSGETRYLDFKEKWPSHAALAKHILGMANTEPGCIVVGVAEKLDGSLEAIGLNSVTDKADIVNGLKRFLPSELLLRIDIHNFKYDASEYKTIEGKSFQVMLVEHSIDHAPFVSMSGGEGVRAGAIYVRRQGQTSEATHDELQRIINFRIEAGYSTGKEIDLKSHIEQLRILYSEIPTHVFALGFLTGQSHIGQLADAFQVPNPDAPKESLNQFILRMIDKKKTVIEGYIGERPLNGRQLKALENARKHSKAIKA